jgi:nucleoid-associated protein YgaU
MDVPILFDGYRYGTSVELDIRRFQLMAIGSDFNPPPTVKIDGALPVSGATWVITSIDWGTEVFWSQTQRGQYFRLRQDAIVHLLQFQAEERLKITITNSLPNHYIAAKGDTLQGISKAMYGNGSRWKEIKAANPSIRDPNKIPAGKSIRIP